MKNKPNLSRTEFCVLRTAKKKCKTKPISKKLNRNKCFINKELTRELAIGHLVKTNPILISRQARLGPAEMATLSLAVLPRVVKLLQIQSDELLTSPARKGLLSIYCNAVK